MLPLQEISSLVVVHLGYKFKLKLWQRFKFKTRSWNAIKARHKHKHFIGWKTGNDMYLQCNDISKNSSHNKT